MMEGRRKGSDEKYCVECGEIIRLHAEICPHCGVRVKGTPPGGKSKIAAGLFGIFLGSFGVHKFYLGRIGWGILYLLFFWTAIPGFVGVIEGILYLTSSDQDFNAKYNSISY